MNETTMNEEAKAARLAPTNGSPAAANGSTAQVVTAIAPANQPQAARKKMTLAEVRAKLDGKTGRRFWKNLDELAETSEFHEMMQEEFPRQSGAGEWIDAVSRRSFLKVMGASFALAGLAGCTKQPDEPIFPYIKQPEDLILGPAHVLCECASVPNRCGSGADQVGRVPSDQGGRQSGAPDDQGALGYIHAGDLIGAV